MCTESTDLLRSVSEAQSASVKMTSSPSNFQAQHRRPTKNLKQCFIVARCFRCGLVIADINYVAAPSCDVFGNFLFTSCKCADQLREQFLFFHHNSGIDLCCSLSTSKVYLIKE